MDSLRKWFYKPKAGDRSLLARFFHADRSLSAVSSELDSFDGRSEPERCSRLVGRLRQGQDRVLAITGQIMDELLGDDRAPREFRVKFPEEVLQDSLGGQLWFGAECLAAGSSIMNREVESAAMRPLAKAVTKSLDNVRNLLREQCLRNNTPNGPLKLDANDILTEMLYESLKIFDKLFAEFELLYVSAMVPVKSKQEFEIQEMICVLFSETLHRALTIGLLNQEQVDSFDPALMFSIPRLAIVSGLVVFSCGPLNVDQPAENMSEMFRPFKSLLTKIRDLLWTLNKKELYQLEKLLCTNEELSVSSSGLSYDNTELVGEYCSDTSSNKVIISSFYSLTDEQSNWSSDTMQDSDAKSDIQCDNTMIQDCASGYLIPNANFGTLLQTESLLSNSFLSSDESTINPFESNEQYITNSFENLTDLLHSEQSVASQTDFSHEQVPQPPVDSGISTGNTSLDRTPESEQSSTNDACLQSKYNENWKELYRNQSEPCQSNSTVTNNNDELQSTSAIKNVNTKTNCDNLDVGEGPSGIKAELIKQSNEVRTLVDGILNKDITNSDSVHKSDGANQAKESVDAKSFSESHNKSRKKSVNDVGYPNNSHIEGSSCDTSPCTSDCGDPREVALAIRAAGRARFSSTEDLLHRLFVCIAGVADQLQTNFASDLRQILRSVFLMNTSPSEEELASSNSSSEQNSNASFEYRASETDIVQSGGSNQSIYSAQEVVIEPNNGNLANVDENLVMGDSFRNERSQSVTTADSNNTAGHIVRERSSSFCDNIRNSSGMKRSNHATGNSTGDLDRLSRINNNPAAHNGDDGRNIYNPSTSSPTSTNSHEAVPPGVMMCPPSWIPDSSAPQCMSCNAVFTAFKRRHHCRRCGGVFCGACSATSTPLPRYGMAKAVRVCRSCYLKEITAD